MITTRITSDPEENVQLRSNRGFNCIHCEKYTVCLSAHLAANSRGLIISVSQLLLYR